MNSGGWQYVSTPAERDQLRDQGWEIVQAGGRTYARQEAPEIAQQRDLLKLQQEYATPNNQYQYITGDESHPGGIFNRNTGQFTQFQTDVTGASVDQIAEAIKSVESGGNYEAQGGSGEFGAYQFMPETWADWSSQYADEVLKQSTAELEPTPENQDAVAKWKIQQLVNQGYTPQQVASIWNSGSPEWEGKTGTNQYGINYDVPNYVRKVTNALQNMAGQGQISPLAKKVIDDPSLLQTMTPTKATEIREELANAGYDVPQVIGFEDKINLERDLKKEFEQYSKSAKESSRQIKVMNTSFEEAKKDPDKMNAASQGVLVVFQKMLDPTSVVRESEYARSATGLSLAGRMESAISKLQKGGEVSLDELRNFVEMGNRYYEQIYKPAILDEARLTRNIANEYGLNEDLILTDSIIEMLDNQYPAGTIVEVDGVRYKSLGNGEFEEVK
jgi:hypothetical protein